MRREREQEEHRWESPGVAGRKEGGVHSIRGKRGQGGRMRRRGGRGRVSGRGGGREVREWKS